MTFQNPDTGMSALTDDEIAEALRREAKSLTPIELVDLFVRLKGSDITQFSMIKHFKAAFPEIPLPVLKEASASNRVVRVVGRAGINDAELTELLGPWFINP